MSAPRVRVIALGNPMACDDGAAMEAARRLRARSDVEVLRAGRPGAALLDLLDPDVPVVLVDVVRLGSSAGGIIELALSDVAAACIDGRPLSSHGLGVAQALALAEALGRRLPRGLFIGFGGVVFDPGTTLDVEVAGALGDLVTAIDTAVDALIEG